MGEIIAAAAHLVLRAGDRFALVAGTEERTGTVLALEAAACVRFRDDLTGEDLLADLAHWDSVRTGTSPALGPEPSSAHRTPAAQAGQDAGPRPRTHAAPLRGVQRSRREASGQ